MRIASVFLVFTLIVGTAALVGAEDAPSGPTQEEKRLSTILYGIDSEIIDLIKTLQAEKNTDFNDELLTLLEKTKSTKLRIAVLDYFSQTEWSGAETAALAIAEQYDLEPETVIVAALGYLAAVRYAGAVPLAKKFIETKDKRFEKIAIKVLGRSGDPEAVAALSKYIESASSDALEQEAILAIGELGPAGAGAFDAVLKIAKNKDKNKMSRLYAADSLGKIGDERAIPVLVSMANEDDPLVRTYAVSALGMFSTPEAKAVVVEALRDSYIKVRIAAIQACGKKKWADTIPFLRYKAENDPEKAVKTEAFKALAEMGDAGVFEWFRSILSDTKKDQATRTTVFSLLMKKDIPGSLGTLESILALAIRDKDQTFFNQIGREVVMFNDLSATPLVKLLLAHEQFGVRFQALDWIKRNKCTALKAEVALLLNDPVESIRKKAEEVLASL